VFTAPKTAPLIIGVTFNVVHAGSSHPVEVATCWRDSGLQGVALVDEELDWNQHFHQLANDPSVSSASATIVFNHTLRVKLPIPPAGKAGTLRSLGALVRLITNMMHASGEFVGATPGNHLILYVATLAGIPLATPAPGYRHLLPSKRSPIEPRPLTELEWRHEKERARKRLYYLANSERIINKGLRYKQDNPDKVRAHATAYNDRHRAELNAKARAYYEKNKESINEKHRDQYAEDPSDRA
jgi:hypothetical protein